MNEFELKIIEKFFKAISREIDETSNTDEDIEIGTREKPFVTGLIYDCLRKLYYQLTIPERIIDPPGEVRTWIGKKLHETRILGDDAEVELELEYNGFIGKIDEYKDGILLEKKTTRHIPREPRPHHIKQCEFYKFLLEKNGRKVDKVAIIYINVNTGEVVAFDITKSIRDLNEIEKEINEKLKIIKEALEYGILPPRKITTWDEKSNILVCNYCPYFGICIREDVIDERRKV